MICTPNVKIKLPFRNAYAFPSGSTSSSSISYRMPTKVRSVSITSAVSAIIAAISALVNSSGCAAMSARRAAMSALSSAIGAGPARKSYFEHLLHLFYFLAVTVPEKTRYPIIVGVAEKGLRIGME